MTQHVEIQLADCSLQAVSFLQIRQLQSRYTAKDVTVKQILVGIDRPPRLAISNNFRCSSVTQS